MNLEEVYHVRIEKNKVVGVTFDFENRAMKTINITFDVLKQWLEDKKRIGKSVIFIW